MAGARPVFYVSDGTGITAETIGHSLLTQFNGVEFDTRRIAFVDSVEKAEAAVAEIRRAGQAAGCRPVVVNTVVDPDLNWLLAESGALMLDLFAPFIAPLEQELGVRREARVGHAHGLVDFAAYEQRINATNYALTHDDGMDIHYDDADVILVGVSRSGKTPTCLYMALQYGIFAANFPFADEEFESGALPASLAKVQRKLYGLTIAPERLQQIRNERRPNSKYSSSSQVEFEVRAAEAIFKRYDIPCINTTECSIEEIASRILDKTGLERRLRP
jgi:regulator of PEP synthase PpsR (kinase-PPPase family)